MTSDGQLSEVLLWLKCAGARSGRPVEAAGQEQQGVTPLPEEQMPAGASTARRMDTIGQPHICLPSEGSSTASHPQFSLSKAGTTVYSGALPDWPGFGVEASFPSLGMKSEQWNGSSSLLVFIFLRWFFLWSRMALNWLPIGYAVELLVLSLYDYRCESLCLIYVVLGSGVY